MSNERKFDWVAAVFALIGGIAVVVIIIKLAERLLGIV